MSTFLLPNSVSWAAGRCASSVWISALIAAVGCSPEGQLESFSLEHLTRATQFPSATKNKAFLANELTRLQENKAVFSQGRIEVARIWAANGQASTSLSATLTQMEGVCSDNNRVVGFLNAWCLWDSSMAALGGTPVYCTQCGKGSNHLHKYKG